MLEVLRARGASFFPDLASACGLDADALRQAIGALVACGLAASDGFSGLRALVDDRAVRPRARAQPIRRPLDAPHRRRRQRTADEAVETQAWALLRRYGVVFRRLLTREANAAPWRELARVYRRLEARGEIRGGRFVTGMSRRAVRACPTRSSGCARSGARRPMAISSTISTADPLNLAGIVTPGERMRAATRNKLVYRDGVPLAVLEGDFVRHLVPLDPTALQQVSRVLSKRRTAHIV